MSEELEKKVVTLEFNNKKFDKNIKDSQRSLEEFKKSLDLEKEIKSFKELEEESSKVLSPLEEAIVTVEKRFSAMEMVAFSVINRITNKVLDLGETLVKSLSVDQIASGWEKYESQITAMQSIVNSLNNEIEGDLAAGFNLADNESAFRYYMENYRDQLSLFYDEMSADQKTVMGIISSYESAGVNMAEASKAAYGVYALVASAGRPLSEAASAANVFAKTLNRSFMAGDYYSLSARQLDTREFKQLILETAEAEGLLKKVSEGTYVTIEKATNEVIGSSKTLRSTIGDLTFGFSDEAITVDNLKESLSSGWLSGKVMSKAVESIGEFWTVLQPVIDETQVGATKWSKALRQFAKAPQIMGNESPEELAKKRDEIEKYRKEFLETAEAYMKDSGTISKFDDLREDILNLTSDELALSRKMTLALQEAKSIQEATDAIRTGVSTRFSNIYESLFGNYLQARDIFTNFSEWLYGYFVEPIDVLDKTISTWSKNGGFDAIYNAIRIEDEDGTILELPSLMSQIATAIESFTEPIHAAFAEMLGINDEDNVSDALYNKISSIFGNIYDFVTGLILNESEYEAVYSITRAILSTLRSLGVVISFVWNALAPVRKILRTVITWVAQLAGEIADLITNLLEGQDLWANLEDTFSGFDGVFESLRETGSLIISLFGDLFGLIAQAIAWVSQSDVFKNIITILGAGLQFVLSTIGLVISIIDDLIKMVTSLFGESEEDGVASKITTFFSDLASKVKGSSVGIEFAKKFSASLRTGFAEIVKDIRVPFEGVLGEIGKTIIGILKYSFTLLDVAIDALAPQIRSIAGKLWNMIKSGFIVVWEEIKKFIKDAVEFLISLVDFDFLFRMSTVIDAFAISIFTLATALGALSLAVRSFVGQSINPITTLANSVNIVSRAALNQSRANVWKGIAGTILATGALLAAILGAVWFVDRMLGDNPDYTKFLNTLGLVGIMLGGALLLIAGFVILLTRAAKIQMHRDFGASFSGLSIKSLLSGGLSADGHYMDTANGLDVVPGIILSCVLLIAAIAGALYLVSLIPVENIWKYFAILIGAFTIIMLNVGGLLMIAGRGADLAGTYTELGLSKKGFKGSRAEYQTEGVVLLILSLIGFLAAVVGALYLLSTIEDQSALESAFKQLIIMVAVTLGMVALLMVALREYDSKTGLLKSGGTHLTSKISGVALMLVAIINSISTMFIAFAGAAYILSLVPDENREDIVTSLMAMIGVVSLIVVVLSVFARVLTGADFKGFSTMLIATAVLILAAVSALKIFALGLLSLLGATSAIEAWLNADDAAHFEERKTMLMVVFGAAAALMLALLYVAARLARGGSSGASSIWAAAGVMTSLSIFVVALAGLLAVMAFLASYIYITNSINEFVALTVASAAIIAAFGILITAMKDYDAKGIFKVVLAFAAFAAVLAVFIGSLAALTYYGNWQNILASIAPMVVVIGGFALLGKMFEHSDWKALTAAAASFILFAAGVAGIILAISVLKDIDSDKLKEIFNVLSALTIIGAMYLIIASIIATITEGIGALILIAVGAAFVLFAAGLLVIAASIVVLGDGLIHLADGLNYLNRVNFAGFTKFVNALYDVADKLKDIITYIGLINFFLGFAPTIFIIALASSIFLVAKAVEVLVDAIIKMHEVMSQYGDGFWLNIRKFIIGFMETLQTTISAVLATTLAIAGVLAAFIIDLAVELLGQLNSGNKLTKIVSSLIGITCKVLAGVAEAIGRYLYSPASSKEERLGRAALVGVLAGPVAGAAVYAATEVVEGSHFASSGKSHASGGGKSSVFSSSYLPNEEIISPEEANSSKNRFRLGGEREVDEVANENTEATKELTEETKESNGLLSGLFDNILKPLKDKFSGIDLGSTIGSIAGGFGLGDITSGITEGSGDDFDSLIPTRNTGFSLTSAEVPNSGSSSTTTLNGGININLYGTGIAEDDIQLLAVTISDILTGEALIQNRGIGAC